MEDEELPTIEEIEIAIKKLNKNKVMSDHKKKDPLECRNHHGNTLINSISEIAQ